ncbi:hypothetical protein [Nonomuraea basaltis]|uniref:hypothetical protein n=1 Tax=Nonomuraea basaltis TaxID=2495887 RepID=UPI00110C683B|nr:hypothetical protein [Nonomuraea basaltis]TMR92137.1 hypothetical protein EJK15_46465 [Nonomuraea basaltis]
MEQQQAQQIEQQLRQNWQQIRYRILDQFAEVSPSDLDFARNVSDLVERIADKSHHTERYVETRLLELVGVGGGQQGQPFGVAMGQQQGMQQGFQPSGQQGRPFGG